MSGRRRGREERTERVEGEGDMQGCSGACHRFLSLC